MTWLILREPGKVPQRKGPFPPSALKETLRDFMGARPTAFIDVVEIHGTEIDVQDGPECLEMLDERSAPTAARHRASTRRAFATYAASHVQQGTPLTERDKEQIAKDHPSMRDNFKPR